jgi:hypothetical protein
MVIPAGGQLIGRRCRHLARGAQSGKVQQVTAQLLAFDFGATRGRQCRSRRYWPDDLRDAAKLPGFVQDRRHRHRNKKYITIFATKSVFIRRNPLAVLDPSYRGEENL